MSFVCSVTPSLAHKILWLRKECAAGCPVVETPQAESSESQGKVIAKASISYFHHCLKPDDTSAAVSS